MTQSFWFSVGVVFFFFGFVELVLRFSGFEPVFHYKSYAIPSRMEEMDPVVLGFVRPQMAELKLKVRQKLFMYWVTPVVSAGGEVEYEKSYPSLQTDRRQFESRNSMMGKVNWSLKHLLLFRWMRTWGLPEPARDHKEGLRVPLKQYRENLEALVEGVRKKGGRPVLVSICNFHEYQDTAKQTAVNKKIPFFNFPAELEPYLSTVHDRFPDLFVIYFEAYGEGMEANPMLAFLFPDRCHPNEIGHSLMAEVLFETFKGEIS